MRTFNPIDYLARALTRFRLKRSAGGQFVNPNITGRPVWTDWSTDRAIRDGFKASTWVYASVDKIAKAAASVPWRTYRIKSDGEREEIIGHPLTEIIRRPNPFMSRKDLIERMTSHLYLGGNSLHYMLTGSKGMVLELWPIMPDKIKPVPCQRNFIKEYDYRDGGVRKKFKPEEILHNMFLDPSNLYWGMGPLQVAARTVDTDTEAVKWNKIALQNRAVTDGAFIFDRTLNREEWQEARKQIREQHQGANNARMPWVLGSGAKWHQMSLSPADMDFIEGRKMTREEIVAIFGVPPPIVGIYDNATLANIETARRIFWLDTVIPYLEDLKSNFNMGLTPRFASSGENIELDYDLSNVEALQENFKEKLENAKALWNMGVPFNDIDKRLELGIGEIEGGDVGYLPTGVLPANMPIDMIAGPEGESEGEGDIEEDDAKKKSLWYRKTLSGVELETEEQKKIYWKSIERDRIPFYARWTKQASELFRKQARAVERGYKRSGESGAMKAIDDSVDDWRRTYIANYRSIIAHFGKRTYDGLKAYGLPTYTQTKQGPDEFNPWDREIREYISNVTAWKVAWVTQTTKDEIAKVIYNMREDQEPVDRIARAIRDKIGQFSTHRSFRIARTEVVSASNYGSLEAARQTGHRIKKQWVSSRDDRVRDSHVVVDFETREIDEEFSNGLLYPGDMRPGTDAAEVVHCRCGLAYKIKRGDAR